MEDELTEYLKHIRWQEKQDLRRFHARFKPIGTMCDEPNDDNGDYADAPRFRGVNVADREEVYPPIFRDEVLSEAEERLMPEYIKHHIKRRGKSEEGRGGRDGREQRAESSFERGGRREEGGGAGGRAARPAPPRKRFAGN